MSEREYEKSEPRLLHKDKIRDPPTGGKTSDPVEPAAQTVDPPSRGGDGDNQ
jgi:hypothetical protein